jgi:hypothetical protein
MEAACESARHAVNAILDHYVWVESSGVDRRENTTLDWRLPFGLRDQGYSTPSDAFTGRRLLLRLRHREQRAARDSSAAQPRHGLLPGVAAPSLGPSGRNLGPRPYIPCPFTPWWSTHDKSQTDYTQQLLAYLQAWRQYLEQAMAAAAPAQVPTTPPAVATTAGPPSPTTPPQAATTTAPAPGHPHPTTPPPTSPAQENVPPRDPWWSEIAAPRNWAEPAGGPFSQGVSLYQPGHSTSPPEPASEHQPASAYLRAAHRAALVASVQAAPQSLYSGSAAPTAPPTSGGTGRAQEPRAVSATPEDLELVKPFKH